MAAIESTNLQNILVQSLHDMFLPIFVKNHPFLDRMRKVTAGGSGYRIPIMTGPGGGAGGDFVTSLASANSDGSTNQGFVPVPAQVYGHELINWESQPYTDTPQSPVNVAVLATKNAMNAATDNLASMLLGGGFGVLGKILSATNTSGTLWTIIFTIPSDAIKFNEQNVIVQKVTPTTSGLTTGTGFVTGVNQIQGSIEIDTQGSGFTPAATNVVGLQGQLLADTTPTGFQGTQAWCPPVASRTNGIVGDTFLGVPRTLASNAVFTSGWAWNGAGLPLFNAIQAAAGYMSNYRDAKPDTLYCNPLALPKLAIECDQKIRYDMKSVSGRRDRLRRLRDRHPRRQGGRARRARPAVQLAASHEVDELGVRVAQGEGHGSRHQRQDPDRLLRHRERVPRLGARNRLLRLRQPGRRREHHDPGSLGPQRLRGTHEPWILRQPNVLPERARGHLSRDDHGRLWRRPGSRDGRRRLRSHFRRAQLRRAAYTIVFTGQPFGLLTAGRVEQQPEQRIPTPRPVHAW